MLSMRVILACCIVAATLSARDAGIMSAAMPEDLRTKIGLRKSSSLQLDGVINAHVAGVNDDKISASVLDSPVPLYDSGFVTFAGKDGAEYIDGAVMLGLSLQKYAPSHRRFALVIDTMSEDNQEILKGAGWRLLKVGSERPDNIPTDFFKDHYGKLNTFKVPVKRGVFLDADTNVFSSEINSLLEMPLEDGQIAMVHDCCNPRAKYNSGVMRFTHSPDRFASLWKRMSHTQGHDQVAINDEFGDRIVELPAKYNIHGPRETSSDGKKIDCDKTVIAHYTGVIKPTDATVGRSLQWVRDGHVPEGVGTGCTSSCPVLYKRLFCEMKKSQSSLTKGLQTKLMKLELASDVCEH